jgi:predicted DNA-binding WGR domain protein
MARVRRTVPPLPPFHHFIAFSSIDAARNRARFYRLVISSMEHGWVVVSYRGRVHGTQQVLVEPCATQEEAMMLAARRCHDRLLHGYSVIAAE